MQTAPIRLVVLGDVQAELQTCLYQCGPSARHRPGHPYPAPISLRVASNSADTLALVQEDLLLPSTCCALFVSQLHASHQAADPIVSLMKLRHPTVPIVCWGDSTRADLTSIKGCHIVLDWAQAVGTAPLVAVLHMLEGKEVKHDTRLRISKPPARHQKQEDDALIIPMLALGVPTFYRPPSRQVRAVDVGDVHIPLERGSGGTSTSARDARRGGEQSSDSRQRAQGKHPWDRMTFFLASDSERTKMLLEELRARRAQERTAGNALARQASSHGTAAGSAAAGGRGGGGGGPLDRVSTSSSALWADMGRGGALGPGQPHDTALPFAWDDDLASLGSYSNLEALLQEAEALDRASMGGPLQESSGRLDSLPLGPGGYTPMVMPTGLASHTPSAAAAAATAATAELVHRGRGNGAIVPANASTQVEQASRTPSAAVAPAAATATGSDGASAAASIGCNSPAIRAAYVAEQLAAHRVQAGSSEQVRALAMEVEQLRRLVKVKRALEQLQEVPEVAEAEGAQGSEGTSDAAGVCSQAPEGLQDVQAILASAALGAPQAATLGVS